LEQIESLRELTIKAASTLSDLPRNPSPNIHRMEDIICKIMDLENDINRDINHLLDLKAEIMGVIKQVSDTECQTLLELRYLCFKRWEEIAVEMSYSSQHVYRLHEQSLKAVESVRLRVNVIE
jgi:DNA-directed RNA polymerase specialized sigma subunit